MQINTAIVTGATGFIGKALTIKLLKQGSKVYAIDINEQKLEDLRQYGNVIPIKAYFEDYKELYNQIVDEIDVFYHFAFEGGFEGDSLKNYELQLRNTKYSCDAIMLAIKLNAKRFIYASTINELEIKSFINKDSFEPRFTCIYSSAKIATEMMGRTLAYNYGIEFISGLIAMPFGEYNTAMTLPNIIINKFINNEVPKLIEGNNKYDLVYIDDVSEAFIAIGERGINFKSYYIGHSELKTFKEIILDIKDILNPQMHLIFGEYKDTLDLDYSLIDLDALYNDTGFKCKADFKESILKVAGWLKESNRTSK